MQPDALVPVHAEAVDGDERALRWVMPAGTLDFVGAVRRVPVALQVLVDDGTVEDLAVEPAAVRIRLSPGRRWQDEGARLRTALQGALAIPDGWVAADPSADRVLAVAVQQVIDGDVGDYIRSHGGAVALRAIEGERVELELSGACSHCPAADLTLTQRFEVALRALYPPVREVTARTDSGLAGGRRLLGLSPSRRR